MLVRFDDDSTLIIMPQNSIEAMALRYWEKEYEAHGDKLLSVSTAVPIELPYRPVVVDDD